MSVARVYQFNDALMIKEAVKLKLPITIFAEEKRAMLVAAHLRNHLPNVDFDQAELVEDPMRFAWLLRVRTKDGRIATMHVDVETFPELTEAEWARLVLLVG